MTCKVQLLSQLQVTYFATGYSYCHGYSYRPTRYFVTVTITRKVLSLSLNFVDSMIVSEVSHNDRQN